MKSNRWRLRFKDGTEVKLSATTHDVAVQAALVKKSSIPGVIPTVVSCRKISFIQIRRHCGT